MNKRLVFVGGAVAAGIVGVLSVSALAGVPFPLPGASQDSIDAANGGYAQAVDARTKASGLVLAVDGVVADSTQVLLSVSVAGQEQLGGYFAFGPTTLTDDHGNTLYLQRSANDHETGRTVSLTFPGRLEGGDSWQLDVESLEFPQPAIVGALPTPSRAAPGPGKQVNGPWIVDFHQAMIVTDSHSVLPDSPKAVFATGTAVVDSVVLAPSGTVVQGHLEGFAPQLLPAIHLVPALTLDDGKQVALVSGHSGFGTGGAQFEFRYPVVHGRQATFSLLPQVNVATPAFQNLQANDRQTLLDSTPRSATWVVNLP